MREAVNLSKENRKPESEWGNSHIHIRPNFSSLLGAFHAVLKGVAEEASYLEISNFFDPFAYNDGFGRVCLIGGIVPIASTELMAIVDSELVDILKSELGVEGVEGIKINDKTPGRIYIIISGYNPNKIIPDASFSRMFGIRKAQHERTVKIAEKLSGYTSKNLVYGLDRRGWLEDNPSLFQERYVADIAHSTIQRKIDKDKGNMEGELKKLGITLAAGQSYESKADVQEAIRNNLFKKPGQPAYIKQTKDEFYNLSEVFKLAKELDGIVKIPLVCNGKDFSDIDESPEKVMKFCEVVGKHYNSGIHAIQLIPIRNDNETVKRFVTAFYNAGYLIDLGTEHNDGRERPIMPLHKDGTRIGKEIWEMVNKTPYVELVQSNPTLGVPFLSSGQRTIFSREQCADIGKIYAERIKAP